MPQINAPINTNDQSLDRVLAASVPVLLIATANGVNSTVQVAMEDIARTNAGQLLVAKVNISENPQVVRRFNIGNLDTLVAWKENKAVFRLEEPGATQVREAADYLLGRGPAPRTAEKAQPNNQSIGVEPTFVNETNFAREVLQSATPVLVDFWAAWCGPCRMIAPTLDKFSREYAGKLRIAKLNVDQNPRLAQQYGAHSIPLLVLFKGGKPVQQIVGAYPEPQLRQFVEQAIR